MMMRRRALADPQRKASSEPIGVGRSTIQALGAGNRSSVPVSCRFHQGSNANGIMPAPVMGKREARRLECTAADPIGKVEGRTRRKFCRLHAVVHSACLLAGEVSLETARENSIFRAAQRELVGTLAGVKFGEKEIGGEIGEISFLSETQYVMGFLKSMGVDRSTERAHI